MRTSKKSPKPKKDGPKEAGQSLEQDSRKEALRRLDKMMEKYRRPGHSIVDELIAERRAEALKE